MSARTESVTEREAWRDVAPGWRQLYGDFDRLGVSVQWHDFRTERSIDWGRSFHPRSLEFCLNLEGRGEVNGRRVTVWRSRLADGKLELLEVQPEGRRRMSYDEFVRGLR